MGGSGSGPYGSGVKVAKKTTGQCHMLDIRKWQRQKALKPGIRFVVTFGYSPFVVGVAVNQEVVKLFYSVKGYEKELEIILDETKTNYGIRKWFLCPLCSERKAVLYLDGEFFACRSCHNLNYASSHYSGSPDYYHHQLRKICRRLGAEYNPRSLSAPQKPKGMHEHTYFLLRIKYHRLAMKREDAFISGAKRILGWK